ITSYLFGLTSLRLSQLVVGSFSSVPLVFIFNCVGAALRDIDNVDFGRLHLSWQKALLGLFGLATATVRGFMGKVDFSQRRRIEPMRHKEGAHVFQM
ncbi:SNARE associated Golgi protein, partial [Toxoplasma gondii TgCatPRC2]